MSGAPHRAPPPADFDRPFRESRIAGLIAVNINTFWSIAILLLVFVAWDAYADPVHWQAALRVRLIGVAVVVATGLFQKLPGRARWMPLMAKVRLVTAVVTAAVAAAMLDRGYGFAVAGVVAMILTGPYSALDVRDLLATNIAALIALAVVMVTMSLDGFSMLGTAVFTVLAMLVSLLLGRVLEASHRRAFALEMELQREARTDPLTAWTTAAPCRNAARSSSSAPAAPAFPWRSFCATSITSRRSTIVTVTRVATRCCARWPARCGSRCVKPTC